MVGLGVNDAEREQLAAIAKAGGGEYFSANDAKQLADGLGQIKAKLVRTNLFVENFGGPGLKDGLRIVNDDAGGRAISGGKLTIVAGPGSITSKTLKNIVIYEGPAAQSDYDVTLDVGMDFTSGPFQTHQSVGMMLFQPAKPQDRLVIYIVGRGKGDGDRYRAKFSKISGGNELPGSTVSLGSTGKHSRYSMRIEKRGFEYTAYAKAAGAKDWTKIGNQSFLGRDLVPGFYAWRAGNRPEALVEIERFSVDAIEK